MNSCKTRRPAALRKRGGNGFDRPGNGPGTGARPGAGDAPACEAAEDRRELVCRACRVMITRRDLAMPVNGAHRHVFCNPSGLVFEIGCFASARNVRPLGPPIEEFTWFPGHAWEAVVCAGCAAQLGWRYTSAQDGFYGLILAALAEERRA